jgi:hypothetical protein
MQEESFDTSCYAGREFRVSAFVGALGSRAPRTSSCTDQFTIAVKFSPAAVEELQLDMAENLTCRIIVYS